MAEVALGSLNAGNSPRAPMSASKRAVSSAARSMKFTSSSRALRRMSSSTSVMLRTQWV